MLSTIPATTTRVNENTAEHVNQRIEDETATRVRRFAALGRAASVPVSLCGEAASRPLEALAVLGVGVRSVSMPAGAVPAVKAMVRSLDLTAFSRFLMGLRRSAAGGDSLRTEIAAWARDHGISL